jgi:large subunit ribosomal protein L4e
LELPQVFETPYRPEVIHKVYVNVMSHSYQRQGRYPAAGEMVSAESRNTGLGIARLARARGEGFQRAGQAASVAGVRHGRVAHPPESWKTIYKKINEKERRLGLSSAIAATSNRELVAQRGHKVPENIQLPIVVSNEIESIRKAKEVQNLLSALGMDADLKRARGSHKVNSGTARRRGRSARSGLSALIVVGNESKMTTLSTSIPGIDIKRAEEISVLDLAPGSRPARLTIYSENAVKHFEGLKTRVNNVMEIATRSSK